MWRHLAHGLCCVGGVYRVWRIGAVSKAVLVRRNCFVAPELWDARPPPWRHHRLRTTRSYSEFLSREKTQSEVEPRRLHSYYPNSDEGAVWGCVPWRDSWSSKLTGCARVWLGRVFCLFLYKFVFTYRCVGVWHCLYVRPAEGAQFRVPYEERFRPMFLFRHWISVVVHVPQFPARVDECCASVWQVYGRAFAVFV